MQFPAQSNLGNIGVIVSARTGSTRLPGKALLPLAGVPLIIFLLRRLKPWVGSGRLVMATTDLSSDDVLAKTVHDEGVTVYRGDAQNLIARHVGVADKFNFDTMVRITGDCPFIDVEVLNFCLGMCLKSDPFDLATTKGHFPVGIDLEVFSMAALMSISNQHDLNDNHREHLTLYFYDHPEKYRIQKLFPEPKWRGDGREWTVDYCKDYERAERIVTELQGVETSVEDLLSWTDGVNDEAVFTRKRDT